ncbi:winged helix DNA-binding domain-containing protein [Methanooceanicella nereidis]|nr:winged helix DNA-binding domain-containing protein [Methanocella sp. CWC-04]
MNPEQVRRLRLHAQHLDKKSPLKDAELIIRSMVGVNAQFYPAMMLSLCARIKGLEQSDIEAAIKQKGLVRTWTMRGTIHLHDPSDSDWLIQLLSPVFIKKGIIRRRELGLDEEKVARCLNEIHEILKGVGPITRVELIDRLIERGLNIDRKSQAPYHLIVRAALEGLLYVGPESGEGEQTYYYNDGENKQQSLTGDDALAELAIRYLKGYGPATQNDFASWSGLTRTDANKGWSLLFNRGLIKEIKIDNHLLWAEKQINTFEEGENVEPVVNLLPAFDSFVLGYADREYLVPEKYRKEVYHGGQTVPVVLVDGLAAGTWKYERHGKRLNIRVSLFKPIDKTIRELIEEEANDIGRFWGQQASLSYQI